ncbi:MAG: hypothetical protein R3B95_19355, partial [Nitrospirales bacterium]|nr:hypothetical protein [Nitrospirales bacterium]
THEWMRGYPRIVAKLDKPETQTLGHSYGLKRAIFSGKIPRLCKAGLGEVEFFNYFSLCSSALQYLEGLPGFASVGEPLWFQSKWPNNGRALRDAPGKWTPRPSHQIAWTPRRGDGLTCGAQTSPPRTKASDQGDGRQASDQLKEGEDFWQATVKRKRDVCSYF